MVLSLKRWIGKVAVVTGASSGIGKATAIHLVKSGLLVAALARRSARLEQIAKELKNEKGKFLCFKCDVRNEEEIIETFKRINETVGTIQILINNAGLLQPTELIDGNTEMWRTSIDTNIWGLCLATKEAIKYMRELKVEGHIIHLNSILGHRVIDLPGINLYGATKYAVTALTETLRREVTRKELPIRVTSISPGYVKTEFAEIGFGNDPEIPGLEADDVADAIVFAIATPSHVNIKEVELEVYGSRL